MKKLFSFFLKKSPNPTATPPKSSTPAPAGQAGSAKSEHIRTPAEHTIREKGQTPAVYREIYADDGDLGYC